MEAVFMKSILIKDTTREEREQIIKESLDCGRNNMRNEKVFEWLSEKGFADRVIPPLKSM